MLFHSCCCWAIPEWILILYICQRKESRWNRWLCVHLLITSNHNYQFNCSISSWDQCHLNRDPEHPKLKRRNRETRQPDRHGETEREHKKELTDLFLGMKYQNTKAQRNKTSNDYQKTKEHNINNFSKQIMNTQKLQNSVQDPGTLTVLVHM